MTDETLARFASCVRSYYSTANLVRAGNAIVGRSDSGDELVESARLAVVEAMDAHLAVGGSQSDLDAELARINVELGDPPGP